MRKFANMIWIDKVKNESKSSVNVNASDFHDEL